MRLHVAIALSALAGCATAGRDQAVGTDASAAGLDARTGGGGRDAAPVHDGPAATTADAPQADSGGGSPCAMSGVVASWTFTSEPGSQATTAVASSAPGVVAGDVQRAASLHSASGAGSMNASNWTTSAQLDTSRYYTLSVTPPAGCSLDITSAAVDAKASASGPATAMLAASSDGYAHTVAVSTSAPSMPTLAIVNQTAAVEIRIYGFAATSAAGTMRLQNTLSLSGRTY